MTTTVTAKIQVRKGTAAQWTSANPTLLSGEIGYETDTGKQKIGDGATAWTGLTYYYDPANSGGVTDHGALTGLADDDHTQYHTDARGDARYAVMGHNHSGTYEPADATILKQADVDDTPVNGVTTAPVSSNWAFDHAALTTAHGISTFGSSLVDDSSASTARTTLGTPVGAHGFEGRSGSSLTFAVTTLTLNVSTQVVWLAGVRYAINTLSCDLGVAPDVGLHFIVAQDDGLGALELVEHVGAWSIVETTYTPVATVYWNGTSGAVADERHSYDRNLGLHAYLHSTVGARIENDGSFAQTRPTTANDSTLQLVAGSLWDEDIENAVTTAQGKLCRHWYETASSVWTFADGIDNGGYDRPVLWNNGTSRVRFPESDNSYALADASNANFVPVWVYASNDIHRPIYIVTPSLAAAYTTIANARTATAPVLPFAAELKLLYRWIYRGDGEYQEAADYRTASSLPSGGVSSPVAAAVSFSPAGSIAATNVQAALEELDAEKLAVGADAADLGSGTATDNYVLTADGLGGAAWEVAQGGSSVSGAITVLISQFNGGF